MSKMPVLVGTVGLLLASAAERPSATPQPATERAQRPPRPARVVEVTERWPDGCPALEVVLPEFMIAEPTLEQVLALLSDFARVDISVDWQAVRALDVQPATSVPALRGLWGMTLAQTLRTMFDTITTRGRWLDYECRGNLIRISTRDALEWNRLTRVYDARAPLLAIEQWQAERTRSRIHLEAEAARLLAPRTTTSEDPPGAEGAPPAHTKHRIMSCDFDSADVLRDPEEILLSLLMSTVEPDTWTEYGGGQSTLKSAAGLLIVDAPRRVHAELHGVLEALRQSLAEPIE